MNRILIENLVAKHEGRRVAVYKDSKGILTIGIGFNLEALAAPGICSTFGLNYQGLLDGTIILTEDQIDEIFQFQLNNVIAQAQATFPTFNTFPDDVQAVICDMIFQLGWKGFQGFHHTISCIKSGSWKDAAANMLASDWAKETPGRAREDASIMEAA